MSHCSKTVVDFTQLTDKEILQIIQQNSGKLCGRMLEEQLNRTIQLQQPKNNSQLYKMLAGLLLLGTNENSVAKVTPQFQQGVISSVDYDSNNNLKETKTKPTKDSVRNIIHGWVIDSDTKVPLPYAAIIIKGSKIGTPTGLDGEFKLMIPDSLLADKIILVISHVGYKNTEVSINKGDLTIKQEILIPPSKQVLLGEVVVIKKKKWWQKKNKSSH